MTMCGLTKIFYFSITRRLLTGADLLTGNLLIIRFSSGPVLSRKIVLTHELWLFSCAIKRHNNNNKLMTNGQAQCDMAWEKAGEKYPRKSSMQEKENRTSNNRYLEQKFKVGLS